MSKILVLGASGSIGRKIIPLLSKNFDFFLTDRAEGEIDGQKVHALDITDYNAVLSAMQGMDAVVHLAIASIREFVTDKPLFDTDEGEEYLRFNQIQIDVNMRGTYNIFEAARFSGVKRIVYGSSMTVLFGKPSYPEYNDELPARPFNFYGVTKLFGEQLGEYFSRRHGMTVICLRIGQPHPIPEAPAYKKWVAAPAGRRSFVTFGDIAGATQCALTAEGPALGFGAYTIVSASKDSIFDCSKAKKEIGWEPKDFCEADGSVTPVSS